MVAALDWVIHGGESGRKARPFHMEWATTLRRQSREHGVPYFLKQLGSHVCHRGKRVVFEDAHAGDWSEWPTRIAGADVASAASLCLSYPESA